jgi:ParB-like chromosome segregation protein Spo0J
LHTVSRKSYRLSIQYMPVTALKPYERNARTHNRHQRRAIARSIEKYGFLNPVLIDSNGRIIAGHGRVEAAKMLGLDEVPRF